MLFLFSITWGIVSGWWGVACLLLGLLYAWLMYRQPAKPDDNLPRSYPEHSGRYLLFAFRALAVSIMSILLLAPLIKQINYKPEKPLILILQDNSESIKLFSPSPSPSRNGLAWAAKLGQLKYALGDAYDVRCFNFDRGLNNGMANTFNGRQTNISAALKQLNYRFVNQNIGALVLATDGLYNQGSDPQYEARNFKAPIYTLALGDTTPRRDLLIANVNYNKTALLGNDFVIEVLAGAYQSKGETMRMSVNEDGRQVARQTIAVNADNFQKLVSFKLNADKKGMRKFIISIAPVKNELSVQNNLETIYVEVLDARQKILLVYNSPHPDIDVIKQGIESNRNYQVKTSLFAGMPPVKPGYYSLIILHQLQAGAAGSLLNMANKTKTPVWFMLGAQTNLPEFNKEQNALKIFSGREEVQEVFTQPVQEFSAFMLSDSARLKLSAFPPLLAPFGSYTSSPANQVLLKQKIGDVATAYPLLSFSDAGGQRIGILTGEGLWRWQLSEYKTYGSHNAVEELLSQSVQYLTANAGRQQFRVYPADNVFDDGEEVMINAELYNDALELINTPDVKIDLKSASDSAGNPRNYSFLFTRNSNNSYQLNAGTLPVGQYSYTASAKLGNRLFTASGGFTVNALNLESRQSVANHQLLKNIARESGGQMLLPAQINRLADLIKGNDNIKTVVYKDDTYNELIGSKWVFLIILALLSAEWFTRKRAGQV